MNVGWSIWLKEDDVKIFGKGPKMLLLKIDELGSLRKASISMELSYTKALSMILNLEKGLGIKVLEKQIGGKSGGGSTLTNEIRQLIEKYDEFEMEVAESVKNLFDQKFK